MSRTVIAVALVFISGISAESQSAVRGRIADSEGAIIAKARVLVHWDSSSPLSDTKRNRVQLALAATAYGRQSKRLCIPSQTAIIHVMKLPESDTAYFFELETSLHKRSVESASRLLAEAFIEFGSSGRVWNKDSIVEGMRREQADQSITVEDFAARELAPDVVLVTYISKKDAGSALRSSIWKHHEGKWQMIFHQGTRTESPC